MDQVTLKNGHGSRPIAISKAHRPIVTTRWRFGGIKPSLTVSMRAGRIIIAGRPEQTIGFGIKTVGYLVALFGAIAGLGWIGSTSILSSRLRLLLIHSNGGRAFIASLQTVWFT